jgi:hypothetical protein
MVTKYTAIIVEPRKHAALEFVLNNFLTNLNNDWSIVIYHGLNNKEYINDILDNKLSRFKYRVTLKNLNVNNLTIDEYNNLMTNKDFINNIPTETFLIFQTDTMICESSKDLINNFIDYDYVGSPWHYHGVGNGGLSLRKKSKMLEILDKCKVNYSMEDEYFSNGCDNVIINKPSFKEAKKFGIEHVYNNESFGIHKAWEYQDNEKINNQCKNYNELVKLNNYTENYFNSIKINNLYFNKISLYEKGLLIVCIYIIGKIIVFNKL